MKFQYWPVLGFDTTQKLVLRPMLEIELFTNGKSITIAALVDSGADGCLFNIGYAQELGLNLKRAKTKSYTGISGPPIAGYILDVSLRVKHIDKIVTIPIAFVESQNVDALLGQTGFFDAFRIKFEKDHNLFEVNPTPKK